jgi:hypothetical protein
MAGNAGFKELLFDQPNGIFVTVFRALTYRGRVGAGVISCSVAMPPDVRQ